MATFLAYFDLLGYKKFIENNSEEHLDDRTNHFGRNIEMALSLDLPNIPSKRSGVFVADISQSTLNCLTFSDTVILWTSSNTLDDFEELLKVAYKYNFFNVMHDFPSRGCIVFGEIWYKPFDMESQRGGRYILNMIYGRALIDAHLRAESMSWAGCELAPSALEYAMSLGDITSLLERYVMDYAIPFKDKKDNEIKVPGKALRLAEGRLLITKFYEEGIASAFTQDNKGKIEGRTKVIFDNTIEFLRAHQIQFPFCYLSGPKDLLEGDTQIFGKLEEDYTHTTITVRKGNGRLDRTLQVEVFNREESDRDFLNAAEITLREFEQQENEAKKSG